MRIVRDLAITLAALIGVVVGIWVLNGKRLPGPFAQFSESVPENPTIQEFAEWGHKCESRDKSDANCMKMERLFQSKLAQCRARMTPKDYLAAMGTGIVNGGDSALDGLTWCEQRFPDLR